MSCLTDKVAIVTGSSRGLGRACARELADHGAKVVLNYYTNQESADELLAEMKVYCTYAAVPHMIERGGGRIVNMSSIVGQMGNLGQSNYAAAKAGIVGFSKSAAQELAKFNITVNALCPGFIETEMVINLTEDVQKALLAKIPLGRFGQPGEVARICRFLVTEGEYITGAQININGGMYMQ